MNTYSAELSGSLNTCAYSSANETNTSDEDSTSSYDIPYTADFQTKSIFEQFSVIDSNHDNYSWQYDEGFHAAVYPYSENAGDDWLVSPAIRLKAGHIYTFKAIAAASGYPEKLEVLMGRGDEPVDYKDVVIDKTVLSSNKDSVMINDRVTVAEDGNYRIAVHAISDADNNGLYIHELSIVEGIEPEAPDSVNHLSAAAEPTGLLEATVSFTSPTRTVAGDALNDLTKIVILQGDQVLSTIENPVIGHDYAEKVPVSRNGNNIFRVIAYNKHGVGQYAETSAYVGVVAPLPPLILQTADHKDSVTIRWRQVGNTGWNGGPVIPSEVGYYILSGSDTIVATRDTTATFACTDNDSGSQYNKQYAVGAYNAGGSSLTSVTMIVGSPYILPYHNSFDDGTCEGIIQTNNVHARTGYYYDSDGGYNSESQLVFWTGKKNKEEPRTGSYSSPKITLDNSTLAVLTIIEKSVSGENCKASVSILTPEGKEDTISTFSFSKAWKDHRIVLDKKYAKERYIIAKLNVELQSPGDIVAFDDIFVEDVPNWTDAAVTVSAPEEVLAGSTVNIPVTVTNKGQSNLGYYKITYIINGERTDSIQMWGGMQDIAVNTSRQFDYKWEISPFDVGKTITFSAEVYLESDLFHENDTSSTISLTAVAPGLPEPREVTIVGDSMITWRIPKLQATKVTENFESYKPWMTSQALGIWDAWDEDLGFCGAISSDYTYSAQNKQFGFTIFNPEDISPDFLKANPSFAPSSGKQYAAAIHSCDSNGNALPQDNYLISPHLSEKAQTIRFMARNISQSGSTNPETIELLYNDNYRSTHDAVLVKTVTIDSGEWTPVEFNIPGKSKFFLIHHNTKAEDCFMLGIDDISFEAGPGSPVRYTVYKNKEVDIEMATADNLFCPTSSYPGSADEYYVTAVYFTGHGYQESSPAKAVVSSGIANIRVTIACPGVYSLTGVYLGEKQSCWSSLQPGVYIINGKKAIKR